MRVVIVAEHASAQFGGEAFLPLNYFRLLRSRKIETWLVSHMRTQAELEALFPDAIDHMHFVEDTWLHRFLYHSGKLLPRRVAEATTGILMHLYTEATQRRIVRQLVQKHQIDIVHQPIPVSPKQPSLIFSVGAPVVIGPMNGGINYPPAFQARQSRWVEHFVTLGRVSSNLFNRLLPGKLNAHTLLVANQRTKQALPAGIQGMVVELVENGVDLSVWRSDSSISKSADKPVQFVYVGRLVDWKAVDLLLTAFQPVATTTGATLELIGDGVLRQELEAQAANLGLADHVIFTGWLSQANCAIKLQQADAFVLASLLECGGAVVLEAMAMGLPVIATNWGGPVDYVDASCGILVAPTSPETFVTELTAAMFKLAESSDLRSQLGQAGRQRVLAHFDWERKVDQIIDIYQQTQTAWQTEPIGLVKLTNTTSRSAE
jgi:glycosyltransferase involved in cell wall biosynthesis